MGNFYQFKTNFYIMYYEGRFVLTNTTESCSYVLDKKSIEKLMDEDASYEDFINAKIVTEDENEVFNWPYAPISKFFYDSIKIREQDLEDFDYREFWLAYLEASEDVVKEELVSASSVNFLKDIKLPEHRHLDVSFYGVLKDRLTSREFFDKPVTLQEFADILFISFGKFHEFDDEYLDASENVAWRRSSPSAGGLNNIQCYVLVHNVEGLEKGVYFYDGKTHILQLIERGYDQAKLARYFLGQDFYMNSAFNVMLVSNLKVVHMKYKYSRGFVLPYMDSGYVGQTLLLAATGLGLQTWLCGAFCDDYFRKKLHLSEFEIPLTFFAIGHGYKESLGPRIRKELKAIKEERVLLGKLAFSSAKQKVEVQQVEESESEEEK